MTWSTPDGMKVDYDILVLGEDGLELRGRVDVSDVGHFMLFARCFLGIWVVLKFQCCECVWI